MSGFLAFLGPLVPYLVAFFVGVWGAGKVAGFRIDDLKDDVETAKTATRKAVAERDEFRDASVECSRKTEEAKAESERRLAEARARARQAEAGAARADSTAAALRALVSATGKPSVSCSDAVARVRERL